MGRLRVEERVPAIVKPVRLVEVGAAFRGQGPGALVAEHTYRKAGVLVRAGKFRIELERDFDIETLRRALEVVEAFAC